MDNVTHMILVVVIRIIQENGVKNQNALVFIQKKVQFVMVMVLVLDLINVKYFKLKRLNPYLLH